MISEMSRAYLGYLTENSTFFPPTHTDGSKWVAKKFYFEDDLSHNTDKRFHNTCKK